MFKIFVLRLKTVKQQMYFMYVKWCFSNIINKQTPFLIKFNNNAFIFLLPKRGNASNYIRRTMSSHIAAKVLHDETSVSLKVYLVVKTLSDHENSNSVRWENQFTNTDTRHTYSGFLLWWSTNARACRIEFVVHQHPSQNTENIRGTDDESCFGGRRTSRRTELHRARA